MGKKDMEVMAARIAEGEAREAAAKRKEMKEKLKKKKDGFFADFKKFITKGNIIDMAVGVIVGTAFTAIINALSNGILKPFINYLLALVLGKDSLSEVYTFLTKVYQTDANGEYVLDAAGNKVVDLTNSIYIDWGTFVNAIINFFLVAFTLFVIARIARHVINKAKARELAAAKEAEEKKKADEKAKAEATAAVAAEKEAQLQAFYANVARQTELLEQLAQK